MKTKFNSFLNEHEIFFDSVFTTPKVETRVEYLETVVPHEDYLIDVEQNLTSTVVWQLDPDMNNSRIKSMGLMIMRVYTSIEW